MTTDAPLDGAVEGPHDEGLSRRRFLASAAGAAAAGAMTWRLAGPGAGVAGAAAFDGGRQGRRRPQGGRRDRRGPDDVDAGVATAWFDLARTLVRTTLGFTPPVASRAFAYAGLALYEAVVPGSRRYKSLQPAMPGLRVPPPGDERLDWPAVANAALASVMRQLFPTTSVANRAAIDALEASLSGSSGNSSSSSSASALYGRAVADSVFAWSRTDGGHEGYLRNFPADYVAPAGPGLWVPTPPAFQSALQPAWGRNRCFAIASGEACPSGPPTRYSEDRGSDFYAEAVEVYRAVNERTPEQEAIAQFWADDPGVTATPPGHSISIATQVLRRERASLMLAAETYAKVAMAVGDAFIACWDAKFRYNLLRPVTYIRAVVDPAWSPLLVTPPFPEHTSGHSVQSGAAFHVLTDLFGRGYRFEDHTHDDRGLAPRRFNSFRAAADEAALSRLYGGIHFRPAIELGLEQGRCVGRAVSELPFERRGPR
jgi:PAP2 superfamily